jgi:tubulin--tyrosine ligase
MIEKLLSDDGLEICWTTIWRNSYGRLFKSLSKHQDRTVNLKVPGPDTTAQTPIGVPIPEENGSQGLLFNWDPDMDRIISPPVGSLPVGSDGWALERGWVSVTPLRATFGEAHYHDTTNIEGIKWKVKLRL